MLKPLTAANLAGLPGVRHGFFTRAGGTSDGIYAGLNCGLGSKDEAARVIENRRRVAEYLGAAHGAITTLYQVHGATALCIDTPAARDNLPKADAVVTATPGLAVGVLTADCTPVLFADPEAKIVAAAHAGWRGAVAGIIESTITAMESLGARRATIRAALGPSIGSKVYEVGPEFEVALLARDPGNEHCFFLPAPEARVHFDLPRYVAGRLERAGIHDVVVEAPCTFENESLFFSYRRAQALKEPDYGRQISAIVVA